MLGRVMGGISTSLLFSAFESWMVSQHRKHQFPEQLLADTFSIASWGNGIVAIIAGILAQVSTLCFTLLLSHYRTYDTHTNQAVALPLIYTYTPHSLLLPSLYPYTNQHHLSSCLLIMQVILAHSNWPSC